MDVMQKVFVLRQVKLFSKLPGETLLAIAEQTNLIEASKDETIFSKGDPPTGLYIIARGSVLIVKNSNVVTKLKEHDFFGELALLDSSKRSSDAIAQSDSTLLFLDKETFDRITEDLPEVLRAVVQVVLSYLREYH